MVENNLQPARASSVGESNDSGKKKPGSRSSRRAYNSGRGNAPRQPKFEGACDELKGHIFDYSGYEQTYVFVKTLEQITIYVGRTYSNGGVLAKAIETLTQPVVTIPDPPANYGDPAKVDHAEKFMWEQKIKEAMRTEDVLVKNVQQIYAIGIGQYTDAMVARVEAHKDYVVVCDSRNAINLLKMIKTIF